MTPEQENQFILYGCGSRCLIAMAQDLGIKITRADFIDRFYSEYPIWAVQCGITNTSTLIDLARKLGISHFVDTTSDWDYVRDLYSSKKLRGALLVTSRQTGPDGTLSVVHHCRWVTGYNPQHLILWHPDASGVDIHNQPFPLSDLCQMKAHFVLFLA